jgi:ATP-dependent DNA ligase
VASPGFLERILARARARTLDERLLAGARPAESRLTMARSAELLDPRYRSEVAEALRDMLDAAEHARRNYLRAQLTLREFDLVKARTQIRDLADALEGSAAANPRGVILADRLVRDGNSPMYWPSEESVEAAVQEARAALDLS